MRFLEESKMLVVSDALLAEIMETGSHPKFRKYFTNKRLDELIHVIKASAIFYRQVPRVAGFSDKKDEFLLDLCQASDADFLVTGDKALLNLAHYNNTEIISLARLKEMLS